MNNPYTGCHNLSLNLLLGIIEYRLHIHVNNMNSNDHNKVIHLL